MNQFPVLLIGGMFGLMVTIIILKQPFIGVALTVVSTPISSLLPPIPYFSSAVPLIGAVSLVGFLWVKRENNGKIRIKLDVLHTLTLLFLVWIFISNPQAAWSGIERNWIFTYLQLLVLMIIASNIMDEPYKQRILMGLFTIVVVVSAYTAITQGYLGEDIFESVRVGGFTAGANTAARYFVIAMVLLTYLRTQVKDFFVSLLMLVGIIITYLGVFFTASRSGMILIFFAQLLLFFFQHDGKQRARLMVVFGVAFLVLFLMANTIFTLLQAILPAIVQGTDTIGLRYDIWEAGWHMWRDHPVRGVGIGMFQHNIRFYMAQIGATPRGVTAHNTYISILSETGIIGFSLFMTILIIALKNLLKKNEDQASEYKELRITWLIVFLVMLFGAVTKTEHVDKLLFMVIGLSAFFGSGAKVPVQDEISKEHLKIDRGSQEFAKRYR